MSINKRMDKQSVLYPYNGILLSNKGYELPIFAKTWMNLTDITLISRSQTYIVCHLYDIQEEVSGVVTFRWRGRD